MLRTNEIRKASWNDTCECTCRLDGVVYNNKQLRNNDKCRCECNELIDKGKCDNGLIWNTSICKCQCDESCDVEENLDYANCKCRKRLIDKLNYEMIHNFIMLLNGAQQTIVWWTLLETCKKSCSISQCLPTSASALTLKILFLTTYIWQFLKRRSRNLSSNCKYFNTTQKILFILQFSMPLSMHCLRKKRISSSSKTKGSLPGF